MVDAVARIVDNRAVVVMYGADLVRSLTADGEAAIAAAQATAIAAVETAESDAIAAITPLVTQAEAAQTAAEAAQAAAETAETNAETAETNAETAQAAAEVAQAAIEATISTEWVDDLPLSPAHGQTVKWGPTREVATYDEDTTYWHLQGGVLLHTVADDWSDMAAGERLSNHLIEHSRLAAGPSVPMTWNHLHRTAYFLADGDGAAYPVTTAIHYAGMRAGCLDCELQGEIYPSGASGSGAGHLLKRGFRREAYCLLRADNGRFRIDDRINGTARNLIEYTIPGFAADTWQAIRSRVFDNILEAEHVASGIVISTATPISSQGQVGIVAIGVTSKVRPPRITPLDTIWGIEIGGGWTALDAYSLAAVAQAEPADRRLINGRYHTVTATASPEPGIDEPSGVFIIIEGANGRREERVTVLANSSTVDTTNIGEIGSLCFFERRDGVVCIAWTDQTKGHVVVAEPNNPEDYNAGFRIGRIITTGHNEPQDVRPFREDGADKLLFTFRSSLGGVSLLTHTTDTPLTDPASWTEEIQCTILDAWGLPKSAVVRDFDDDGIPETIVFTCRGTTNGGVKSCVLHGDGTITTIKAVDDAAHIDWYDLGDGNGNDIVYQIAIGGTSPDNQSIYFLEFANAWAETSHLVDNGTSADNVWSVTTLWPIKVNGRPAIFTPVGQRGEYVTVWDGVSAYESIPLRGLLGSHISEGNQMPVVHNMLGLGDVCLLDGNSYMQNLEVQPFLPPSYPRPASPAIITAYATETQDVLDAWTTATVPLDNTNDADGALRGHLDQFIRRRKDWGLWADDLAIYLAVHDEGAFLFNIRDPASFALTKAGTTTFTAWTSVAGNGTDGTYATGLDPLTEGLGLDDFRADVFTLSYPVSTGADIGSADGRLLLRTGATATRKVNGVTGTGSVVNVDGITAASVPRFFSAYRRVAGESAADINGTLFDTEALAADGLADEITLLRASTSYSSRPNFAFAIGHPFATAKLRLRHAQSFMSLAAHVGALGTP